MSESSAQISIALQGIETHLYVLAAEIFLYGVYAVMFGFYIHVIRTRGMLNNRFLTVATMSLFTLCTIHCALLLADMIFYGRMVQKVLVYVDSSFDALPLISIYTTLNRAANTVYIISNVIADSIFIFRCFAIWNFRWTVIILPTILTVTVAVLGFMNVAESLQSDGYEYEFGVPADSNTSFALLFDISITMSVFTTFILMGLSAGRIWWLARTSQKIMGRRVTSTYYTVCAMILESGALYCVGAIPFIGVGFASYFGLVVTDITTSGAILGQLVGIAPTIIAVRVGLGRSVENADSFITASQVLPHKRTPRMPHEFQSADPPVRAIEQKVLYLHPESHSDCETEQVV
ncbi:hypothetical protein B0H11DRAFT_79247 [Mycena galericulata]|nr:hypothetical protein B0H11DRAFT_79247 [Mycena galericulata]